jgi:hypothetical protein
MYMDASDLIKQRRDKAVFTNKLATFIQTNPTGDCANLSSTCCATTSTCITLYVSYEEKQAVKDGRKACVCPNAN